MFCPICNKFHDSLPPSCSKNQPTTKYYPNEYINPLVCSLPRPPQTIKEKLDEIIRLLKLLLKEKQ